MFTTVLHGDCKDVLIDGALALPEIDLVITSPPYANQRAAYYEGASAGNYVEWFLPRAAAIKSVLAPTGSFILNIKEHAYKGEKHPYVYDLVLAMRREQGWRLVDEYCWHKTNAMPGKWATRFRDSWERLYHFTISDNFKMNQENVMVAVSDSTKKRMNRLSERDKRRVKSENSVFSIKRSNWNGREMVYPTNVLHFGTESSNVGHPAAFPQKLPEWFIKLFTDERDVVLDPFAGSGATLKAAFKLGRNSIGIDINKEYCDKMELIGKVEA